MSDSVEEMTDKIMSAFFGPRYGKEALFFAVGPHSDDDGYEKVYLSGISSDMRPNISKIVADVISENEKLKRKASEMTACSVKFFEAMDEVADALVKSSVNIKDFLKTTSEEYGGE